MNQEEQPCWSQQSQTVSNLCWDIAELACGVRATKTPMEKLDACTKIFRPSENYKFPVNQMYGRNRHFRFQWLQNNSWLAYSPLKNGGYCVPCVLFATHKANLGQLVNSPLTNFARAATTLSEHAKQTTHLKSVAAMAEAELRFRHSAPSVVQQLSSETTKILSQNKAKLTSFLKTVVFCAKQNIPLRGHHHESGWSISGSENVHENPVFGFAPISGR